MGRYDPRNSKTFLPYIVGAAAVVAVLYMFLADDMMSTSTTIPPNTTSAPQKTAPVPTPAATK